MDLNKSLLAGGLVLAGLAGLGGCDPSHGSKFPYLQTGIVNGSTIRSRNDLGKSVVALIFDQEDGVALCTGSILDQETILTAAHCVDGGPKHAMVVFGPRAWTTNPKLLRAGDHYEQNPQWQSAPNGLGDLALVHFSGGLPPGFQPVQLAKPLVNLSRGTEVMMVGYGVSNGLENRGAGILRATSTEIEGNASSTQIVTNGRESSVCFGDSGGPAFIETPNGFQQWGVASSVLSKACNEASVHTSVIAYESWIEETAVRLSRRSRVPSASEE